MPTVAKNVIEMPRPKRRTARSKFTDAAVRDLPLQGQDARYGAEEKSPALYHDEELRGFFILCHKSTKSYYVQRDIAGKSVVVCLGPTNLMTAREARDKARKTLVLMKEGVNPNEQRKEAALATQAKNETEGRARDVLVLLLADHEDLMRTPDGALFALALAVKIRAGHSDSYLPSGRIGSLDLKSGCYTTYEVFRLAAQDLAKRRLTRQVSGLLRAGRQTVREFLTERYGVSIGPRQYFTPRGRTPDHADLMDFLRVLRRVRR